MATHEMYRRWKTRPFAILEAESRSEAVEVAARSGIDLSYADLRGLHAPHSFLPGVDLRGVDLTGAELAGGYLRKADLRSSILARSDLVSARLRGADLRYANLRRADLRGADLRDVDLRWADLSKATFVGADVRGVRLTGAKMEGTTIDWRWSGFAVELLSRDPGIRCDASGLVAALAFADEERPFGWLKPLLSKPDSLEWSLGVLGRAIAPCDNAPQLLRLLSADAVVDSAAPAASQHHWTRRGRSA